MQRPAWLGNVMLIKQTTRDMWGWRRAEQFWQDVKYAVRTFRRNPGYVSVALLSLALGIGASTALFSVVYGVLISPYPYLRPDQIWAPAVVSPNEKANGWHAYTRREFSELQKLPAFSAAMATEPWRVLLGGEHGPSTETAVEVTGNGLDFLGVNSMLGRTIDPTTSDREELAIRLVSGAALDRLVRFQFFGAKLDWIRAGAVIAALVCTGALSSWVPARRAASLRPVEALRHEA